MVIKKVVFPVQDRHHPIARRPGYAASALSRAAYSVYRENHLYFLAERHVFLRVKGRCARDDYT